MNGLVDELGGLQQSLDYTANKLGLRRYRVALYPEKRPWFVLPAGSLFRRLGQFLMGDNTVPGGTVGSDITTLADGRIIARLPYDLTIE